jgi:hypothetical protein
VGVGILLCRGDASGKRCRQRNCKPCCEFHRFLPVRPSS